MTSSYLMARGVVLKIYDTFFNVAEVFTIPNVPVDSKPWR